MIFISAFQLYRLGLSSLSGEEFEDDQSYRKSKMLREVWVLLRRDIQKAYKSQKWLQSLTWCLTFIITFMPKWHKYKHAHPQTIFYLSLPLYAWNCNVNVEANYSYTRLEIIMHGIGQENHLRMTTMATNTNIWNHKQRRMKKKQQIKAIQRDNNKYAHVVKKKKISYFSSSLYLLAHIHRSNTPDVCLARAAYIILFDDIARDFTCLILHTLDTLRCTHCVHEYMRNAKEPWKKHIHTHTPTSI